jgi:hypothetical protein
MPCNPSTHSEDMQFHLLIVHVDTASPGGGPLNLPCHSLIPPINSSANSIASSSPSALSPGLLSAPSRARSAATSDLARWMNRIMKSRFFAMPGIVSSAGSVAFEEPLRRAFFLPLPQRPVPLPVPFVAVVGLPLLVAEMAGRGRSGVDVLLLSALPLPLVRACSSPLLVWLVFVRFLLCGLEMPLPLPAEVGASPRCLVYWLLPRRLTLRPATFLLESFSCVVMGGGLSGCEEGGGDAWEAEPPSLGTSSSSPSVGGSVSDVLIALSSTIRVSPSCLLLPALACRLPAASALALSRSTSFSRCSYCRAVIAASALAFLERPPKLPSSPSSSDSSSMVALRESNSPDSDTRRARLTSCLALRYRQSSRS